MADISASNNDQQGTSEFSEALKPLFKLIEKIEAYHKETQAFQNAVFEILEDIQRILERMQQRAIARDEFLLKELPDNS